MDDPRAAEAYLLEDALRDVRAAREIHLQSRGVQEAWGGFRKRVIVLGGDIQGYRVCEQPEGPAGVRARHAGPQKKGGNRSFIGGLVLMHPYAG